MHLSNSKNKPCFSKNVVALLLPLSSVLHAPQQTAKVVLLTRRDPRAFPSESPDPVLLSLDSRAGAIRTGPPPIPVMRLQMDACDSPARPWPMPPSLGRCRAASMRRSSSSRCSRASYSMLKLELITCMRRSSARASNIRIALTAGGPPAVGPRCSLSRHRLSTEHKCKGSWARQKLLMLLS